MKFKASAAELGDQEARQAARKALNRRAISTGATWKSPSPRHCKSYGCENLQTHDLIFRRYYRDGSELKIGYCADHIWNVHRLFKLYREGTYVHRRET